MGKSRMRMFRVMSVGALALASLLTAGNASAIVHAAIYVANVGTSHDSPGYGTSCSHAYLTITYAISVASPGDTVRVCHSASPYTEQVVVDKRVVLQGVNHPVMDPGITGIPFTVTAGGVMIRGFTLRDSFAGIDVQGADHARIIGNIAETSLIGVNIEGSAYSSVTGNVVDDNLCVGISVFAYGPEVTSHITVAGNHVSGNVTAACLSPSPDINVTLQGLPAGIVVGAAAGGRTLSNVVSRNAVLANGNIRALPGCGIVVESPFGFAFSGTSKVTARLRQAAVRLRLSAADAPAGGSVFGNVILANRISGNGLPGVTVLNTNPTLSTNMSGNMVVENVIGHNNYQGFVFPPRAMEPPAALSASSGPTVADYRTTGVLAASASPLTLQVSMNAILGDFFGVWLSHLTMAPDAILNQFVFVPVPVFMAPR